MPKRKRSFRRRRGYRRKRRRTGGPGGRMTLYRQVRSLINSRELKWFDNDLDSTQTTPDSFLFHDCFNIPQGDTSNTRDGNFVTLASYEAFFEVLISLDPAELNQAPPNCFRLMLIRTKLPNGKGFNSPTDPLSMTDVLDENTGTGWYYHPSKIANRKRFKLLKDKRFCLRHPDQYSKEVATQTVAGTIVGAAAGTYTEQLNFGYSDNLPSFRTFKVYKRFRRPLRLQYATSSTSPPVNYLYTWALYNENANCTIRGYIRTRFWDS